MWFSLTPIFLYFISFKYRSMFNFYKKKKKKDGEKAGIFLKLDS